MFTPIHNESMQRFLTLITALLMHTQMYIIMHALNNATNTDGRINIGGLTFLDGRAVVRLGHSDLI